MTRPTHRNDQSTSQEEQLTRTDTHSVSLQTQLQQFAPHIEGPNMDWTVNDGLYHQFLKWKLKCKNILDVNLLLYQRLESTRNSVLQKKKRRKDTNASNTSKASMENYHKKTV